MTGSRYAAVMVFSVVRICQRHQRVSPHARHYCNTHSKPTSRLFNSSHGALAGQRATQASAIDKIFRPILAGGLLRAGKSETKRTILDLHRCVYFWRQFDDGNIQSTELRLEIQASRPMNQATIISRLS